MEMVSLLFYQTLKFRLFLSLMPTSYYLTNQIKFLALAQTFVTILLPGDIQNILYPLKKIADI